MSTARHQLAGAPGTGTTIDNMASRVKVAAYIWYSGGTIASLAFSLNASSVTDGAVGQAAVNFTAPFNSVSFLRMLTVAPATANVHFAHPTRNSTIPFVATKYDYTVWNSAVTPLDPEHAFPTAMGDLA